MANPWDNLTPLDQPPGIPGALPSTDGITPASPSIPPPWANLTPLPDQRTAAVVPAAQPQPPTVPYSATDAAVHGLTVGLDEPVQAAALATSRYLTGQTPGFDYSQAATDMRRAREAYAQANPASSLAANVVGSLGGPAGVTAGAIGAAPTWLGKLGRSIAGGGLLGAAQGAAENTASVPEAIVGARTGLGIGAATGAALPAIGGIGGALFPQVSPAAQTLRQSGIVTTPGNAVGGLPGAFESLLSQVPIAGYPVQNARTAVRDAFQNVLTKQGEDLNRGAVNTVLAKVGGSLNPDTATGHDAIAEMQQKLSAAFQKAVPTAGGALDSEASNALIGALRDASLLPDIQANQFAKFVQTKVVDKIQGTSGTPFGTLSGPDFQDMDSALGQAAHRYLKSPDAAQKDLGEAYLNLQNEMRDWLQRVSPQNATDLQAANEAWRMAKPVQIAASRTTDPNGIFTTGQLLSGARTAGTTPQFARGGALMQQYVNDAEMARRDLVDVGKSLPGPSGHGVVGTGVAGGLLAGELLSHGLEHSPWMLGAATLSVPLMKALYSEPGRRAITGLLSGIGSVPPAITALGPSAGQVTPGLVSGLLNYPR